MPKKISRFRRIRKGAEALLDEKALRAQSASSRWHRFLHFWVLVCTSFSRNRCPMGASALAYTTLLALIPMLAVVVSVTSSFLKNEGEERIDQFVGKLVASLTPPAELATNVVHVSKEHGPERAEQTNATAAPRGGASASQTNAPKLQPATTNSPESSLAALAQDERTIAARREVARRIHQFIRNTRSGALGVSGSVVLIFVAISMLTRIETAFNDIWGVARGRSWFMRIVLYWGVLSLAPLLLIVALGLTTGPHLAATRQLLSNMPWIGDLLFALLPIVVLIVSFALFYKLMPNTKVLWDAAAVGGLVGGLLFHLNNMLSVLYVSRVVSNSKIYGSLGLVPVLMVGLYFCWLILLFGAQVAYAYQNRTSYLEERQVESVDQRGREFIALRLMTTVGLRFAQGKPPAELQELAEELAVPARLVRQVLETLGRAGLVVETAGLEGGYVPARPLESITCHDILLAMRSAPGQEFTTRDEPLRSEVYGEFHRIEEAERQAASAVTLLALVNRAQAQLQNHMVTPRLT